MRKEEELRKVIKKFNCKGLMGEVWLRNYTNKVKQQAKQEFEKDIKEFMRLCDKKAIPLEVETLKEGQRTGMIMKEIIRFISIEELKKLAGEKL